MFESISLKHQIVITLIIASVTGQLQIKFKRGLNFSDADLSSYYSSITQIPDIFSIGNCGGQAVKTLQNLTSVAQRSNAFNFKNNICYLGRVHPLFGFLQDIPPLSKDDSHGHFVTDCLNNVNNLPTDLYGYVYLSDDQFFFSGNLNFSASSGKSPTDPKMSNYKFVTRSPVPSLTGKWAVKFDLTLFTRLAYDLPNPIADLGSFTMSAWIYIEAAMGWNTIFTLNKKNADGSTNWLTGFVCNIETGIYQLSLVTYTQTYAVTIGYSNFPVFPKQTWIYVTYQYDYNLGLANYFINGTAVAVMYYKNLGQLSFMSGLNQAIVGQWIGMYNFQSMASVELYLRAQSQQEIQQAMERSKMFASNPSCPVKN